MRLHRNTHQCCKLNPLRTCGQDHHFTVGKVFELALVDECFFIDLEHAKVFYYFDVEKAIEGNGNIENAIIGVDRNKLLRADFGREVALDLSTMEKEFAAFHFPCNQILDSDRWEEGLMAYDQQKFLRYMKFRTEVLNRYREYQIPIIELKKENSKEAVCLVFEKVNTGNVPLSVFELMTATFAVDSFNLRDDWYGSVSKGIPGRKKELNKKPLLQSIEPTDFLQGISLLYTYDRRISYLQKGII